MSSNAAAAMVAASAAPLEVGASGTACVLVSDSINTAVAMGSGSVPVFATPALIALLEQGQVGLRGGVVVIMLFNQSKVYMCG